MDLDVARIAFVTRRFQELKGLQQAASGLGLLFGSLVQAFAGQSMIQPADPSQVIGFTTSSMMLGLLFLEPRYRSTFGNPAPSRLNSLIAVTSSPSALVLLGLLVDMISGLRLNGPSAAAVGLAVASLVALVRDGRWRPYYLIPLSAAFVAAVATTSAPLGHALYSWERDPQRAPAFIFAYSMSGFGMIVAGVLDHRLLASALGRYPGSNERETGAVRKKFLTLDFAWSAAIVSGCAGSALATVPPGYLGLTLALALSLCLCLWMVAWSIAQARRGLRQFRRGDGVSAAPALTISSQGLALLVIMAAAALADASRPSHPPIALAVAFGACSLAAALTGWPQRRHHLIGVSVPFVVLTAAPALHAVQSFALLICVAAAAVAIEIVMDARKDRDHAHTV